MAKKSHTFEVSTTHQNTVMHTEDNHSKGLYYNAAYEIENFINIAQDHSKGDPFKAMNEPTYTGFKLFFHFDAKSGLLADEDNVNSALAFFKRIGDTTRYDLLINFIITLSKVNSITPWIFQEVTGLDEVYTSNFGDPRKIHDIEIKTLETLDNRMAALIEMHRHIVYDNNRKVYMLPENLRRFGMSIYIYDFRMFDSSSQTAKDFLQTIENTDIRNLNHVMFDLLNCQFDISSGSSYFENISNNNSTMSSNNLTIKASKIEISSLFKTITGNAALHSNAFDLVTTAADPSKRKGGFLSSTIERLSDSKLVQTAQDRINEYTELINGGWKTQLINAVSEALERGIQKAESALMKLYLGNVHGFGFGDLLRLSEDNDFRTSFNKLHSQNSTTRSLPLGNTERKTLGKI